MQNKRDCYKRKKKSDFGMSFIRFMPLILMILMFTVGCSMYYDVIKRDLIKVPNIQVTKILKVHNINKEDKNMVEDLDVKKEVVQIEKKEEVPKEIFNVYCAPDGKEYIYEKVISMTSTAYTDSIQDTGKAPGDPGYGITYTGIKTKVGVVAVDPKVIPLKSKLYIEGYGEAIAADIGGAIKGNRIDVYMKTRKDALNYGRKKDIKVYLLKNEL